MYIHITKRNMGSRIDLLSLLIVLSYINTTAHTCNNSRTCYNILLLLIFDRTGNGRRYVYVYTCGRHFSVFWDYSLAVGRFGRNTVPWHSPYLHTQEEGKQLTARFFCVLLFLFISERRRRRRRRKVQKQKKKEQVLCIHIVTCCWCSWLFLVLLLSSPCCVCVYRRCVVHCNFERRKRTRRYTHTHTSVI